MKCIIVAAGMSTRLRPLTDSLPKCLLLIGGKTILQRTIDNLLGAGITNIALVVGFESEKVRSYLKHQFPERRFRIILNPNFRSTNNAYSLFLARDFFLDSGTKTRESLLLLDSDILFHPRLLQVLQALTNENTIVVRVKGAHDDEEVRVSVDGSGSVLKIGKDVDLEDLYGESIGIERFNHESARLLFDVLDRRVRRGNGRTEYYEVALQEMIDLGVRFKGVDMADCPAVEIDSKDDLELAERTIVPLIDSSSNVRIQ